MGMSEVSYTVAFAGGLLSFASPCVLPLMPGYLGYISGLSLDEVERLPRAQSLRRTLGQAVFFFAGFTLVFTALGLTATSAGQFLARNAEWLRRGAGLLIIVFGLQTAGLLRFAWLYRERRLEVRSARVGPLRSLLLGMAFGFGWTPCVGPILFSVLAHAATAHTLGEGGLLLLAYSLGLGVPFLLTAAALSWSLTFFNRAGRFLRPIQVGAGFVMVAMGALLLTGAFGRITTLLSGLFA